MNTNEASHLQTLEEEVFRLREENDRLRAELSRRGASLSAGQRTFSWAASTWLGSDLREAGATLATRSQQWADGQSPVPTRELINFFTAGIARFTRIGVFRIVVTVLIAVATLWFAVAQVILLHNQNHLMELQKQIEAADRFALFASREQRALRALGVAFDHYYVLKDLLLEISDPAIPEEMFREAITSATLSEHAANEIIDACSIHKYPVGSPAAIASEVNALLQQGKTAQAQSKAGDLRRWLKSAADACHVETESNRTLRKAMEAEMTKEKVESNGG